MGAAPSEVRGVWMRRGEAGEGILGPGAEEGLRSLPLLVLIMLGK